MISYCPIKNELQELRNLGLSPPQKDTLCRSGCFPLRDFNSLIIASSREKAGDFIRGQFHFFFLFMFIFPDFERK